jgi:hypothetical protein
MRLPAAKGTPQIPTPRIARMGRKENATVPTSHQAAAQMRPGPHRRPKKNMIFLYQREYFRPPVPIRPKLKVRLDTGG